MDVSQEKCSTAANTPVKKVKKDVDYLGTPKKHSPNEDAFDSRVLKNFNILNKTPSFSRDDCRSSSRKNTSESYESSHKRYTVEIDFIERSLFKDKNENPINSSYNHNIFRSKEIQHLNSKIKNLIREKQELRKQLFNQNKFLQQFQVKNNHNQKEQNFLNDKSDSSQFQVTFMPKQLCEEPAPKVKKFPRDVFSLPKHKNAKNYE